MVEDPYRDDPESTPDERATEGDGQIGHDATPDVAADPTLTRSAGGPPELGEDQDVETDETDADVAELEGSSEGP